MRTEETEETSDEAAVTQARRRQWSVFVEGFVITVVKVLKVIYK